MKNLIRNFVATLALAANRTKTLAIAIALCCTSVEMLAQSGGNCNLAFTLSFAPLPNNPTQTEITPTITGGTPPYTYNMSWLRYTGNTGSSDDLHAGTIITLGIGSGFAGYFPYGGVNINIADANGCTLTANSCNSTNMALSLSSTITGNQVAWDLNATGGTPPYTYFSELFTHDGGGATNVSGLYSSLQNPVINGVGIGNNGASIHASVFDAHGCAVLANDSIPFPVQNPACTNSTCVFPGDANHDGAANLYDVLTLGVDYGDTGAPRTDQSLTWTAHEASDWTGITPTILQNKKHADCNGNGTINYIDTTAIGLNYHRTHNGVSPTNRPDMTGLPVFLQFEVDTAFLQTGVPNAIYADVFVGNSVTQASNLYGVAFSLNYPAALINPDSAVQVIYDNTSFMGNANNILAFGHDLRADGQFDVALTRINRVGVGGSGRVCRIKWIITENISGKGNSMNNILTRLTETMQVTLSGVRINDNQLAPIASRGIGSSVVLLGKAVTATDEKAALSTLKIYPNPVRNGSLFINANSILIENYQLMNTLGQVLESANVEQNTAEINVQTLPSGVYFIRVATDKGVLTQKIVVAN